MDTVVLGTGRLYWDSDERRTDRYGTVCLTRATRDHTPDLVTFDAAPVGMHGHLVAVVLATRPSPHSGDWARGLYPSTPTVGEEISLGPGRLFLAASHHGNTNIGVKPDDGRDRDWLNPTALYRCHSQTVRLELPPTTQTTPAT
ncbi:hypothetical protein [Saccharopolyspora phatthalungensis]|uniref:Uncharacterized protein n=1 Tax=Saccharopolyspora phatthalungensis TaxID=664693 RepID=A0A840QG25_9PSEU|nr:hypothetical protein [Saccharopolyspora phatthalungensis]MBB5157445.1 hypothetical protein [Saccharopolyspora phatthalungensis]